MKDDIARQTIVRMASIRNPNGSAAETFYGYLGPVATARRFKIVKVNPATHFDVWGITTY